MDQFQPPSNPPLPPNQGSNQDPNQANPNPNPAPAGPPQAPQYGQPAPQYGQQPQAPQAPQYGQQVPGYGQQPGQFGQQPPQAPQYPGYSSNGYGAAMPQTAPVERPSSIKNAVILMYVGAALALIGGIFTLFEVPAVTELVVSRPPISGMSGTQYEAAKSGAQIGGYFGGIFGLVVGTGLWIWMAFANNAGKKWARVLSTVFAAFSIIGGLYTVISGLLTQTIFVSGLVLGILTSLVSVVALVFIWLKPSTEYYNFKSQKTLY